MYGLGWRIHESVEDTKLSTNKQHTLSQHAIPNSNDHYRFSLNKNNRRFGNVNAPRHITRVPWTFVWDPAPKGAAGALGAAEGGRAADELAEHGAGEGAVEQRDARGAC